MAGSFSGIIPNLANENINLEILIGDSIDFTILLKDSTSSTAAPLNLSGYTARAQFRQSKGGAVILDFSSTASPATIAVGSTAGSLTLTQGSTVTSLLKQVRGDWDVKIKKNSEVNTIMGGGFRTVPTTTAI